VFNRRGSPRADAASQAGFSIVELAVAAVMLLVVVYVVTTLSISGSQAQQLAHRQARITEVVQTLSDDMRRELTASVRLFHDDSTGNGYVSLLDLNGAPAGITSRLPTLHENGIFERESAGVKRSGNALLFARHAWTTTITPTPGPSAKTYRIDVYRLVYYYPAPEEGGPQAGSPLGLNLVKWVSEPLADGDQIDKIEDPADQAAVAQHLRLQTPDDNGVVHPAAEVVWLRTALPTATGTLRHIQPSGALSVTPQLPRSTTWRIERDPKREASKLLHFHHHSLATNFAPPEWGIARFSALVHSGSGFPHGFEVQLIGPSSARQILLHLVAVTTNEDGHAAHAVLQTITTARDV
jgi:hypothetical protein